MPLRSFENAGPPNFGLPDTSPFTVEGQIEREVALFAGAKRVGGWRMWVVYGFFGIAGLMLIWTLVVNLASAL
jgi:hypothetical protein